MGALLATALAFQVFGNLFHQKLLFMLLVTPFWGLYVGRRLKREPGLHARWGLRLDTLPRSSKETGLVLILGVALLVAYRFSQGFRPLPLSALWIFLLYPVWSFVQEFAVQALLVANFRLLGLGRLSTILLGGFFFSLAHFPDFQLMALTLLPGFIWTFLFLRSRNLLPLALCHALLGSLAFYWVLERDPWGLIFQ